MTEMFKVEEFCIYGGRILWPIAKRSGRLAELLRAESPVIVGRLQKSEADANSLMNMREELLVQEGAKKNLFVRVRNTKDLTFGEVSKLIKDFSGY